ncbi:MAG: Endonuclease HJR/Mrr/RecB family [Candidatus Methanohalarchaeum thermophilum]|uniref:Endonuclease HJR/Mrr/RecB family n=1 Tax=Methanohalarchaeum thermophilum TaxID=1903181 RepID=A0A1Q6DUY9_METT1|nr:MAG: Endonuclease HJR/Mrr/RecB family [Candidatus Methanohalarchaeum thermophilum]
MKKVLIDILCDVLDIYEISYTRDKNKLEFSYKNNKKTKAIIKTKPINLEELLNELKNKKDRIYLFIGLKGFSEGVIEYSKDNPIYLWDREKLEKELGKSILKEAGLENKLKLKNEIKVTRTNKDIEKTKKPDNKKNKKQKNTEPKTNNKDNTKNRKKEEKRIKEEKKCNNQINEKEKVLNIKLNKNQAIEKSGVKETKSVELNLKPYYRLKYRCKKISCGNDKLEINEKGIYQIDAISGKGKEIKKEEKHNGKLPEKSTKKIEPKIKKETAVENTKKNIRKKLTEKKQSKKTQGESIIYHQKTYKPNEKDLKIEKKGIIYRPIWKIEGENCTKKIDASNGEIISHELDEGVEFI